MADIITVNYNGITLVNATPHTINMVSADEAHTPILNVPASGLLARCAVTSSVISQIGDIPVKTSNFGAVTGLPEEVGGTFVIVSRAVAEACKDSRSDLLIPNDSVRDDQGRIIGCTSFGIV